MGQPSTPKYPADSPMTTFLDLAHARKGHFLMESGLHCGLWFDLDIAFVDPKALEPLVSRLAQSLKQHEIEAVCGPLTGGAFLAQSIASRLGCEFYFTAPATSPTGETASVRTSTAGQARGGGR